MNFVVSVFFRFVFVFLHLEHRVDICRLQAFILFCRRADGLLTQTTFFKTAQDAAQGARLRMLSLEGTRGPRRVGQGAWSVLYVLYREALTHKRKVVHFESLEIENDGMESFLRLWMFTIDNSYGCYNESKFIYPQKKLHVAYKTFIKNKPKIEN